MGIEPVVLKPKYLKSNCKVSKELGKALDYYTNIMHPPTLKGIEILKELEKSKHERTTRKKSEVSK
jgi:hypothetical protein